MRLKSRALRCCILSSALACLVLAACGTPPQGPEAFAAPALRTDTDEKGVEIQVIVEGSGEPAKKGDWVRVHYRLTLENGTQVDSSHSSKPLGFFLNKDAKIIEGFHSGTAGMRLGELRRAIVPHHLGYGEREVGPIPAKSILVFELELVQLSGGRSPGMGPA